MGSKDGIAVEDILEVDETLLWRGPIGFNVGSSLPMAATAVAVAGFFVLWALKLDAPWEFCTIRTHGLLCVSAYFTYFAILVVFPMLAGAFLFSFLERRALTNGKAQGAEILTNRRLIRVSTWPWRRVLTRNYRTRTPRLGFFGVVYVGQHAVILARDDAMKVVGLIYAARNHTP